MDILKKIEIYAANVLKCKTLRAPRAPYIKKDARKERHRNNAPGKKHAVKGAGKARCRGKVIGKERCWERCPERKDDKPR